MTRRRLRLPEAIALFATAFPALGSQPEPTPADSPFAAMRSSVHEFGHAVKRGSAEFGHRVQHGTREAGHQLDSGMHQVGDSIHRWWHGVRSGVARA
ncbi:MAG TPA: hypothetical protein VGL28_00805 [Steroidobacteraceae bacterium]|jgi:hypothetical protein